MQLTGLHLLLSYRCTYECDHCFVYSSPRAEQAMSLKFALDAVEQARALDTMEEIWIEGGEPFLYYPVMTEIIRRASQLRLNTGVVTNSYFAESVEDALLWLRPLKDAGLTWLSASDDTFHYGDDVSASPAKHVVAAALQLGIDVNSICINRPAAPATDESHIKGEPIEGGTVRFRGRAADTLASDDLPRHPWHSYTSCPDEDFESVGRLHLDPYGNLFACQGIVLGNLFEDRLSEIVRTWQPETHPIIAPLMKHGPAGLVETFNLPLREQYLDACHLCFLARRTLREQFPTLLAPPFVYGESGEPDTHHAQL